MQTSNLIDFRGGYFTDFTTELMNNNELLTAENCNWRNGIIKRRGKSEYNTTDFSSFTGLKGAIRAFIDDSWVTILAIETGGVVNFYEGTGTTFTVIDSGFDWQAGYNVEFAQLDGKVVAVNGYNKPAILYDDGGIVVDNLETYDTRTWEDLNIYGGQWDNSESVPFVEDNVDCKDGVTGSQNFQISSSVVNDGFYISSDLPFNKFTIMGFTTGGSCTAEYRYWDGDDWTQFYPLSSPDWSTTANKACEWNFPLDSGVSLMKPYWEEDGLGIEGVKGRFIIRVRFTTAPAAVSTADYIIVEHTQYLTQMLFDERPHTVYTHNGTMFMASRWVINYSPYAKVTGWREYQTDEFEEAGARIMQMISFQDVLVILTEGALFTFNTTSLTDPVRSRPLSNSGAVSGRSAAVVGDLLFYCSEDGIYAWDGSSSIKISKHIQTDFDSWDVDNCAGVSYKNEYILSFPDESKAIVCDPDTFRRDSMGDGQVSWYKYLNYKAHQFIWCRGYDDHGYLLAFIDDDSEPWIDRCDYGDLDDISPIPMTMKTKYFPFTGFQDHKFMGRFKPKIREVSALAGTVHTLNMYSDDGKKSATKDLLVPTGSGFYETTISLPYTMDGKNIAFEFVHLGATSACLIGYALQLVKRRF